MSDEIDVVRFNVEDIWDEAKERPQWEMWDADAETPRRPHWRGDFGISWTDPDDWHTFEEAVEAAEERESWGIGYVFARGNEDYARGLYGALDIDGCIDEDGHPKDWLPSLEPFFDHDAYMEISPSGTGIHIPLVGFELPDWWSNVHFTDDEHEGVEAYTSKFFTVTGDRVRNSGDEAAEADEWVEDWLIEVTKAVTGDDPTKQQTASFEDVSEGGRAHRDEFLDEDDIRDALDHINPDVSYSTWRDIGFALEDFFTSERTALSCFEEWSRGGSKWDSDAADQAERIISDASGAGAGGRTVGTIVHHAREGGWEMPTPSGSPQFPTSGASADADDDSGSEDEADGLPQPAGFECWNGCYGYTEQTEEGEEFTAATNFELEVRSFLIEDDGATVTVELTVHPASDAEAPYDVTVPIDVFTEPRKFRQEVATGRTTTYEMGTKFLNKIRRFVGGQDAPIRTPTRHMGLHDNEWVTPDGVLTADGWSEDPEYTLVDNDTTIPQKWALSPDDGIEYDREAVIDMLERLPKTRERDRFLPVLGWFYAVPLRPLIMEWTGEFNLLNITGDTGAGKTATVETLWEMFGMGGDPLGVDGTSFTRLTAFSSSNAVPVWFDEFKPAEMPEKRKNMFMSLLRKSTRGGTEPRGNADQTENQWNIRAPTVVSGEQLVSGPAEERRSIQTVFSRAVTDPKTDYYRHYARLTGDDYVDDNGETVYCEEHDLADHARAYYSWVLGEIEDEEGVKREWQRAGERVTDLVLAEEMDVHPTVKQGFRTILFGCRLYRKFCDAMGADADMAGVTDETALDAIRATADTGSGHEHVSHLDRFLGMAARASAADYLELGDHYKLVVPQDGTEEDEELRLKLSTAFDAVRRYAQDYDLQDGDLLDAASDYRIRIQDAEDDESSVVRSSSVETWGLNKTSAFSVETATDRIETFERSMWVPEPDIDENDGESDESDDNDGDRDGSNAVSIAALEADTIGTRSAYQTVTVSVNSWESGAGKGPVASGVVEDRTGVVDVVDFNGGDYIGPEIEEGKCYRFSQVKVGTYDGALQLVMTNNTTEVTEIQAGVGYTPTPDAGPNQEVETAADGGVQAVDADTDPDDQTETADTESATDDATDETTLVDMHGMESTDHITRIDRQTQFGNPFKLKRDGGDHTLDESIERYREWVADKIENDGEFREEVEELRGETLGCWCVDSKDACHGEVIIDYLHGDGDTDESEPSLSDLVPRALMYVRDEQPREKGVPHDEIVSHLSEHGASEERAEHAIKKLRERGDLTVPAVDHYRTV